MKFEEFVSGSYKQQYQYKSFQPALISAAVTGANSGDAILN
jgi:hypothetical protein